jgi:hypothetical protein
MTLNKCRVVPKCMLLTKLLNHVVYSRGISDHDEQSILNLELALFFKKRKASS